MSIDDIKKRFGDEIELRAYSSKYVDKDAEREILQVAIQQGVSADVARLALAQVCDLNDYTLESAVLHAVRAQVEAAFADRGRLDRHEFECIFQDAKRHIAGKKSDLQIKRLIVEIIEDSGMNRVKTGWFGNWYTVMKKEIGVS